MTNVVMYNILKEKNSRKIQNILLDQEYYNKWKTTSSRNFFHM